MVPYKNIYYIQPRLLQSESSVVDEVRLAEKHEEGTGYQTMVQATCDC